MSSQSAMVEQTVFSFLCFMHLSYRIVQAEFNLILSAARRHTAHNKQVRRTASEVTPI
jgi:hypothetical protein